MSTAPDTSSFRFDDFLLDVADRQLWQGGDRLDLNPRYFDALALLVRAHGELVDKDRFFAEVWSDVVVSDAALTQCIRTLRALLGDDATNPRYIQTVPRHGYRFVAPVEPVAPGPASPDPASPDPASPEPVSSASASPEPEAIAPSPPAPAAGVPADPEPAPAAQAAEPGRPVPFIPVPSIAEPPRLLAALATAAASTAGGAVAGVFGGLLYGFALAYAAVGTGLGTASTLLVLVALNVLVGAAGGFGVGAGLAAARAAGRPSWIGDIGGAAAGGLVVGGLAHLLGVDAFHLLFGQAPSGITGGLEGAALGAALALGLHLGGGPDTAAPRRMLLGAGLTTAAAGALLPLAGGRLMGGSLALLARSFSESRLAVESLGRFFGEVRFGPVTQAALGGLEGGLFGLGIAGALLLVRRWTRRPPAGEA